MAAPQVQHESAPKPVRCRIPQFESIEEAAEFWDTHDSAEFEDEWEEVDGEVRFIVTEPHRGLISLRFDEATMAALIERARREHTGPGTLVHRWVIQHLQAS